MRIYRLSRKVEIYEDPRFQDPGFVYLQRFLREMIRELEEIRIQDHNCYIVCDRNTPTSNYRYLKEHNVGVIRLQIWEDPRYLVRLLGHELAHYVMDNSNYLRHPKDYLRRLSSYEEVFAEAFSIHQLKRGAEWLRRDSNEQVALMIEAYLAKEYRAHEELMKALRVQGIEAVPLLTQDLLPHYEGCFAVAAFLLPYFEKNPDLWKILPHVQDVHPQSSWRQFFAHLQETADDSYRDTLGQMVKFLLP